MQADLPLWTDGGVTRPESRSASSEGHLGWGVAPPARAAPAEASAPAWLFAVPSLAEWKAVSEAARRENPGDQAAAGRALFSKCPGVPVLGVGGRL